MRLAHSFLVPIVSLSVLVACGDDDSSGLVAASGGAGQGGSTGGSRAGGRGGDDGESGTGGTGGGVSKGGASGGAGKGGAGGKGGEGGDAGEGGAGGDAGTAGKAGGSGKGGAAGATPGGSAGASGASAGGAGSGGGNAGEGGSSAGGAQGGSAGTGGAAGAPVDKPKVGLATILGNTTIPVAGDPDSFRASDKYIVSRAGEIGKVNSSRGHIYDVDKRVESLFPTAHFVSDITVDLSTHRVAVSTLELKDQANQTVRIESLAAGETTATVLHTFDASSSDAVAIAAGDGRVCFSTSTKSGCILANGTLVQGPGSGSVESSLSTNAYWGIDGGELRRWGIVQDQAPVAKFQGALRVKAVGNTVWLHGGNNRFYRLRDGEDAVDIKATFPAGSVPFHTAARASDFFVGTQTTGGVVTSDIYRFDLDGVRTLASENVCAKLQYLAASTNYLFWMCNGQISRAPFVD